MSEAEENRVTMARRWQISLTMRTMPTTLWFLDENEHHFRFIFLLPTSFSFGSLDSDRRVQVSHDGSGLVTGVLLHRTRVPRVWPVYLYIESPLSTKFSSF